MPMPKDFFLLSQEDQSKIFTVTAYKLGLVPNIIEKDFWVCWVLQKLFSKDFPVSIPMAFKGGTSLSKVYNLIKRFSEDIDITFDYLGIEKLDKPLKKYSNNFLKKHREKLQNYVKNCVKQKVLPYFKQLASNISHRIKFEICDDGEKFRIYYPSVFASSDSYILDNVLVEFGGRNSTIPNELHVVQPYIADYVENLSLPIATVNVLLPARTFWEKATLIHAECHRDKIPGQLVLVDNGGDCLIDNDGAMLFEFNESLNRLSRHWYDLAILAESDIGKAALSNRDLLADVIEHKKAFFRTSYANYEACLNKKFQLIPNKSKLEYLEQDFKAMLSAKMFYGEELSFGEIVTKLRALEQSLNSKEKQGKDTN